MLEVTFDPGTELTFVREVLERRAGAIEQFADRLKCVPRILGAHNARLGFPLDDHDLADLAQDVAVIVLKKLDQYAGASPLEGWIYRICSLEFMNGLRRKSRRAVPLREDADVELAADTEDLAEFERIQRAIDRIGGVEAEVIRLKHFDGLTFDEIGRRLAVSPNTIKTRYYRGLCRLEQALGERSGGRG